MQCPKCQTKLRDIEYEGMNIHTCDGCGGEVVDSPALKHIVACREQRFSPELRAMLEERTPITGIPTNEFTHHLSCPQCEREMEILNYGGDSGVIVDRCDACLLMFLDHEELEKIQVLMESWADEGPLQIQGVAGELERVRRETAEATSQAFAGSRFSFVNALINKLLDAA